MRKKFSHLTLSKRENIERMLNAGYSKKEIAKVVGVHLSTIYLEIKRGTYKHLHHDLTRKVRYSSYLAQEKYNKHLKAKGRTPKIVKDSEFQKYLKLIIKHQKYSPNAIVMMIKNDDICFTSNIRSHNTIYTAIKRGYIKGLKISDLPKGRYTKRKRLDRKNFYKKYVKKDSIETRDPAILSRNGFGHWEMDCVIGNKENRKTALVLTERKTRQEIIEKLKFHTADEVVKALNRIEKRFGAKFYHVFKTITVDNGTEFSNNIGMEKSLYRLGNRTKIYYCHPYSPEERGSNENNNILIRRFLPKGSNFDKILSTPYVKKIQDWINTYPRKIFNGKSSEDMYIKELEKLGFEYII